MTRWQINVTGGISYYCACDVIFQLYSTMKWLPSITSRNSLDMTCNVLKGTLNQIQKEVIKGLRYASLDSNTELCICSSADFCCTSVARCDLRSSISQSSWKKLPAMSITVVSVITVHLLSYMYTGETSRAFGITLCLSVSPYVRLSITYFTQKVLVGSSPNFTNRSRTWIAPDVFFFRYLLLPHAEPKIVETWEFHQKDLGSGSVKEPSV